MLYLSFWLFLVLAAGCWAGFCSVSFSTRIPSPRKKKLTLWLAFSGMLFLSAMVAVLLATNIRRTDQLEQLARAYAQTHAPTQPIFLVTCNELSNRPFWVCEVAVGSQELVLRCSEKECH